MTSHHSMQHANHPFNEPPKEGDIATEKYQGPSAAVAAVGKGAIDHWKYAIIGLAGGTLAGAIFHKPAASLVEKCRRWGYQLKAYDSKGAGLVNASKDTLSDWAGGFLHVIFGDAKAAESLDRLAASAEPQHQEWLKSVAHNRQQGAGSYLISHTFGALPLVGKGVRTWLREGVSPRLATAIAFAGPAGAAGFLGGWVRALFHGAAHGNPGKHQFERAQREIKHLREVNEDLEKINDRLHEEVIDEATKIKDSAPDAPKPHDGHHEKASAEHKEHAPHHEAKTEHHTHEHASHAHAAHSDKPHTQTHAHAHQGMLNAHAHEPAMA